MAVMLRGMAPSANSTSWLVPSRYFTNDTFSITSPTNSRSPIAFSVVTKYGIVCE